MTEPMEMETLPPSPHHNQPHDDVYTTAADATSPHNSGSLPSSDSDSDSDSDADESQQALQLQSIESELSRNPSNYDTHLQYIKLLRKMGEIDKLRQAREAMAALFPLTPAMWQEWAKDETTLSSGSEEAVRGIEKLYERGVSDYLSVPLWCDYLNFVQEHEPAIRECSADGVAKARHLFERALTAAGLHFAEGIKIWEMYKEFEQAICLAIDESDIEGKGKQIQRIRTIFHRQLSVPLADMTSSLHAYKMWEVEQGNGFDANSGELHDLSPHVASAYKKALEMYNARLNLEEQISKSDVPDLERLPLLKRYLKFEEYSGDPARVQMLYERAISEFPIACDLWLDYTRYLDRTLKAGHVVTDVINRATRNCPWVGELWVRYLLSLERARASEEEVSLVFEKALQCTFSSYEEYLDLFLTRIDGLRRRISVAGEMQVMDYAVIRDTFQRTSDYLSPNLKGTNALLQLHSYWAHLELSLANDIVAARGVWESLLKISGTMLEAWQSYINMETGKGNLNEARSIYRRCYTKRFPGSGSEDICKSWLRFEREYGTLEDYDSALQKVSPRLEELTVFRLQQESKTAAISGEGKDNFSKKNAREKRKPVSNLSQDQSPLKRQKEMDAASKKGSNIDRKDQNEPGRTNAEESKESGDKSDSRNKLPEKRPMYEKPTYTDQCTAFISNLSLDATYDHLRNFFSDVGGVQSIRILKDKYTGKSRGLAYVDFSDDAHLNSALAKNKKMLLKKKVSIARSDPSKGKKQSGTHHNGDREGTKNAPGGQKRSGNKGSAQPSSESVEQSSSKGRDTGNVELKGKLTFAVPRTVTIASKPKAVEGEEEKSISNTEFREMFLKK